MKNIYILAVAAIILSLGSCTIEKRHYQSGYHVEWNHRNKHQVNAEEQKLAEVDTDSSVEESIPQEVAESPEIVQSTAEKESISVEPEAEMASTMDEPVISRRSMTEKLSQDAVISANQSTVSIDEEYSPISSSQEKSENSNDVSDLVLILLCLFIPPLAVFIYDGDLSTNFWVDLILTCLFWLPGVVFAFLVCFADIGF